MTGIYVTVDGRVDMCAGCNASVTVHIQEAGGQSLSIEHTSLSTLGEVMTVRLVFHSLACFVNTSRVEQWDGVPGFQKWAADKVRKQEKRQKAEYKTLERRIR